MPAVTVSRYGARAASVKSRGWWWQVGRYAGFCPGPPADQPKRRETAAEQRERLPSLVVVLHCCALSWGL